MMKNKWIGMAAILIIFSLVLFACSDNSNTSKEKDSEGTMEENNKGTNVSKGSNEEKDETGFKLKEPAEISMMTVAAEVSEDLLVYKYIKEATNITVKGYVPPGDFEDAIALTVASGDIPDIMYIHNNNILPKRYGGLGVLLDFNEVLDQMPNLKKFWEENPDIKQRGTSEDGKTYQAIADGLQYTNNLVWMYRKDIFEKHNLEVPKTWEELFAVSQELKKLYPDKFPFTFRDKFENIDERMLPSFGVKHNFHPHLDTREIIYGQVTDEYRSLVEYLHKFNAEKLMNPDFLSITTQQYIELMTTGKGLISLDYIGRIQTLTQAMAEEGAQLAMMAPPQGSDDQAYIKNMNYMPGGFTVFKDSKNLDATLHYIDFLFSDEGSELVSWGKQGETYDFVDGEKKIILGTDTLSLRKEAGIGGFGSYGKFDSAATMTFLPKEYLPYYHEVSEYVYPEDIIPIFTETEQQLLSITLDQINKHKESTISRFIVNDRSLDEWDNYVEEMNNLGLSKLIELHDAAFERALE